MLNFQKTLTLIKGRPLEPRRTWGSYLSENHNWKEGVTCLALFTAKSTKDMNKSTRQPFELQQLTITEGTENP